MKSLDREKLPLISFFTGGGFLDLGLQKAGFSIAWTNEINMAFADMYEAATAEWLRHVTGKCISVKVSSRASITDLKPGRIKCDAFPRALPSVFGVVGGPPCPDFSNGGTHSGCLGENGKLTRTFVEMICSLRPDFFLIENVAGLYRFQKHRIFLESQLSLLRSKGRYVVDFKILNALQLGVPQDRERLFVFGCRKRLAERAIGHSLKWDSCGWFPWPQVTKYADAKSFNWPTAIPFGAKPKQPKDIPIELTVYPSLRGNGDPEAVENGLEFFNSYSGKFWERHEGDVSSKSFKRLHRYRYSPTAWYGNQEVHLHPWKPRRLSVREVLRIQTVPDEYILPKEYSLSAKFKMICNGVPCRMAELIGREILKFVSRGAKEL